MRGDKRPIPRCYQHRPTSAGIGEEEELGLALEGRGEIGRAAPPPWGESRWRDAASPIPEQPLLGAASISIPTPGPSIVPQRFFFLPELDRKNGTKDMASWDLSEAARFLK